MLPPPSITTACGVMAPHNQLQMRYIYKHFAHDILGSDLYCFFVDNGLLRPQDYHHIELLQKETPLNIEVIDAKETFYQNLKDLSDPEDKRKAIGRTFIEVFEEKVHQFEIC